MAQIEKVEIRAQITIGNLTVRTPYIQSFNVRKARGQVSSFDASLKVEYEKMQGSGVGGDIVIKAGTSSTIKKIFTGIIKKATISPCWNDPGFVFLNVNGIDALGMLQGKKYSRRCRATKGVWVSIDSVVRSGLRDGKFAYNTDTVIVDPALSHDQINELNETKQQGKNVGKAPRSKKEKTPLVEISRNIDTGVAP